MLIEHFGKELISYDELKSVTEFKVPAWVYGFCIIGSGEYYIGTELDYERHKSYSELELGFVRDKILLHHESLIITSQQLKDLKLIHGHNIPRWAVHERRIGENLHDFSDDYTPWCPLGAPEPKEELMDFETSSGKPANTVDLDDEFPDFSNTKSQLLDNTMVSPYSHQPLPDSSPLSFGGIDDDTIEKLASAFGKVFNTKEDVHNVPPKPKGFYIPDIDKLFIRWGIYADIVKILERNMFYPAYITGLSGNGKTLGIEQACAELNKELLIVNITEETDEDDLLGGYRLVNGNTVWQDGPVVIAMRRGCPLLLDEIDYGSSKLSCLQSVLSGKPVLIKKTGEVVKPVNGFTVFATANTKGQGDTVGKFAGTKILNEAFLDRFPIMLHNPYPSPKVELKIFETALAHFRFVYDGGNELSSSDSEFCSRMVKWCDIVRQSHESGATNDVISTRRGVDILKAFVIFGARERAIKVGVERFNEETRTSFAKLYQAVDEQIEIERAKASRQPSSRDARAAAAGVMAKK